MTQSTTIRPPVRRRRWLSVLLGFVIFGAGVAAGVGLSVVFAVGALQQIIHHPENAPPRITAFIARKVNLDVAQRGQVLEIITRHQKQIQAIRREMRPRFDQQLDQIRAEIDAVLTDEQRAKWEALFDRSARALDTHARASGGDATLVIYLLKPRSESPGLGLKHRPGLPV